MRVRVPGSIANLGAGFDVLAMAVDLWLEVEAEPAPIPRWTFEGEGAEALAGASNVLSRLAMRGRVRNGIPVGVGLGSSAAARLAAAALAGADEPFPTAAEEEGHSDNVAAAAFGGVRLVAGDIIASLPVPDLELAVLAGRLPASTEAARRALPAVVPRSDAVFNAGRAALLVSALHQRRWDLLGPAMEDRLHQPHRRHLYPWTEGAMVAARSAGAHGAAICGAGPSVFAFCDPGAGAAVVAAMDAAAPGAGTPLVTRVCREGMSVEP